MSLQELTLAAGTSEEEALALAARSRTPLSTRSARPSPVTRRRGWHPAADDRFFQRARAGVRGTVAGGAATVGTLPFLRENQLAVPAELARAADAAEQAGQTAVLAGWDGRARAVLPVADALKPGSAAAVSQLRPWPAGGQLTGDSRRPALAVARQLGIGEDDVFPRSAPRASCSASSSCRLRDRPWPWWATGSTTRPPWPRPTWHRDRHRHRRGHRRGRPDAGRRGSARIADAILLSRRCCGRSAPTSPGRSGTTSSRSRWPRSVISTPCSPLAMRSAR